MHAQELPDSVRAIVERKDVTLHRDGLGVIATAYFTGSDEDLRELCKVETLEELHCGQNQNITDRGLAELQRLRRLRSLDLHDTRITPTGLAVLVNLPQLEELSFNPKTDCNKAAEAMAKLRKLRKLDVGGACFTDKDIQLICRIKSLEDLNLELNLALTDESMARIGRLPALRRLSISDMPLGDKACEYVSECSSLRKLSVGVNVTDSGVEKLLKLHNLERLDLGRTKITVRSLELVRNLPELRHLSIMDDSLGDEIVPVLAKFKKLESLNWLGNRLSKKAIAELAASRKWTTLLPDPDE